MGHFQDGIESQESPFMGTLSWNARKGNAFLVIDEGSSDQSKTYILEQWNGVIIDGRTFCVSGKDDDGVYKYKSNLAKRGLYEKLFVRREFTVGNTRQSENLAQGLWSEISPKKGHSMLPKEAKYTKVLCIMLKTFKGYEYVEKTKGAAVTKEVNKLVQFRLTGGAITYGIGNLEHVGGEKTPVDNMDGWFIHQSGIFEKADNWGTSWKYPRFKAVRPLNVDVEKEAAFVKKLKPVFDSIQDWLRHHNEKYLSGQFSNPSPQTAAPAAPAAPTASDMPDGFGPNLSEDSDGPMGDDDLPF